MKYTDIIPNDRYLVYLSRSHTAICGNVFELFKEIEYDIPNIISWSKNFRYGARVWLADEYEYKLIANKEPLYLGVLNERKMIRLYANPINNVGGIEKDKYYTIELLLPNDELKPLYEKLTTALLFRFSTDKSKPMQGLKHNRVFVNQTK